MAIEADWLAIKRVVAEALDLAPGARQAHLEVQCPDAVLLAEATRLLRACERAAASAVLDQPAPQFAAPLLADVHEQERVIPETLVTALSGRYTIERELGRGGMATVYLARDERHGRLVALKLLRPEHTPEGSATRAAARFQREIELAARLSHPHILPLYDSGAVDGLLYYITPYVDGETLRERLTRTGRPPLLESLRVLRDVARALAHAHRHGVVHRDVKPANILLNQEGDALVADFGVARGLSAAHEVAGASQAEPLTEGVLLLGTPAYMAPEQVTGGAGVDHRADLYAFGVVAYELLSGAAPFADRQRSEELLAAHLSDVPEPVAARQPDVPETLSVLVDRLLAKRPEDRPRAAAEVLQVLDTVLAETGAARRQRRRALPAWAAHSRLVFAGAAVAGSLSIVVLASLLLGRPGLFPERAAAGDVARHSAVGTASGVVIAVIPCEDRTSDSAFAYVAEGLSENLVDRLTTVSDLRVVPRGIVRSMVHSRIGLGELARALEASHLMMCNVASAGDELRIGAQLVQVEPPRELWADGGVAAPSALLAIENALLQRVVATVPVRLTAEERRKLEAGDTRDGEAQRLVLLGRHHWHRFTPSELTTALGYFERALELDSTYAKAWVGISMANIVFGLGIGTEQPEIAIARAKEAIARGLAARPDDAELLAQRATVAAWYDRNLSAARRDARRAFALRPDVSGTHQALQHVLAAAGDLDAALAASAEALRLNPGFGRLYTDRAQYLFLARRLGEAARSAEQAIALDPGSVTGFLWSAHAAAAEGRYGDALAALDRAAALSPGAPFVSAERAVALGELGEATAARALLDSLASGTGRAEPTLTAAAWALVDEPDRAFEWLGRAEREGSRWLILIPSIPWFDALRDDPRYDELVRRLVRG